MTNEQCCNAIVYYNRSTLGYIDWHVCNYWMPSALCTCPDSPAPCKSMWCCPSSLFYSVFSPVPWASSSKAFCQTQFRVRPRVRLHKQHLQRRWPGCPSAPRSPANLSPSALIASTCVCCVSRPLDRRFAEVPPHSVLTHWDGNWSWRPDLPRVTLLEARFQWCRSPESLEPSPLATSRPDPGEV